VPTIRSIGSLKFGKIFEVSLHEKLRAIHFDAQLFSRAKANSCE
jgi:hypothetical protein